MASTPILINVSPRPHTKQQEHTMAFMQMLPDLGMNYTFNRPLLDGTSPARLKELSAIAPRIKDYESWHTVWLEVAQRAEAEKRWADAASYYRHCPSASVLQERFVRR